MSKVTQAMSPMSTRSNATHFFGTTAETTPKKTDSDPNARKIVITYDYKDKKNDKYFCSSCGRGGHPQGTTAMTDEGSRTRKDLDIHQPHFKYPSRDNSAQTEVLDNGLWDLQDGWLLPLSGLYGVH
jgi:hypothetical protein